MSCWIGQQAESSCVWRVVSPCNRRWPVYATMSFNYTARSIPHILPLCVASSGPLRSGLAQGRDRSRLAAPHSQDHTNTSGTPSTSCAAGTATPSRRGLATAVGLPVVPACDPSLNPFLCGLSSTPPGGRRRCWSLADLGAGREPPVVSLVLPCLRLVTSQAQ